MMAEADPPQIPNKRRCTSFVRLVQWIRSHNGAFVHPQVDLTTTGSGEEEDSSLDRYLRVVSHSVDEDGNKKVGARTRDVSGGNDPLEDNPVVIRQGEIVFSIPHDVLITAGSCDPLPDTLSLKFKHVPQSDIQLAVYLASSPSRIRPYLDALPEMEATADALPRCWKSNEADEYLAGSPVLHRIREQRNEVQDAYDALASSSEFDSPEKTSASSLSFRSFSQCLAVVTSRSFEGFDPSHGPCCLVPLLDLCNHGRGRSAPASNLSYRWDAEQGCVVVEAKSNLHGDDPLIITYGSQGNASLLLNYGFCILHNLEPDGSSNDCYELQVGESCVVSLRAGPKEYSYSDLVNAMSAVAEAVERPPPPSQQEPINDDGNGFEGVDDIESFLDECEASEEEDAGSRSVDQDEEGTDSVDEEGAGGTSLLHFDIKSLGALGDWLEKARSKYEISDDELLCRLRHQRGFSKQLHATILLQSELRTLCFFQRAVDRILAILTTSNLNRTSDKNARKLPPPRNATPTSTPAWLSASDSALIYKQVESLARVFIQIRHGTLDLEFPGRDHGS